MSAGEAIGLSLVVVIAVLALVGIVVARAQGALQPQRGKSVNVTFWVQVTVYGLIAYGLIAALIKG